MMMTDTFKLWEVRNISQLKYWNTTQTPPQHHACRQGMENRAESIISQSIRRVYIATLVLPYYRTV
jgi:hypothetical protein